MFSLPLASWLLLESPAAVTCNPVDQLALHGFARVKPVVVDELLPRPMPGCLDEAEERELERRLWSLGLFDDVKVARTGGTLDVTVREKWTLIPGIDFGNAKTLRDSYLFGSLTESNVAGRAIECGTYVAYYERAVSGELWCGEHQNAARRLTFEIAGHYVGSGFIYDDTDFLWERRRAGGRFGVRLPFWYGTHWRFGVYPSSYLETSTGTVPTSVVRRGVFLGVGVRATWDRYSWNDVAPRGAKFSIELTPGTFVGIAETRGQRPRHAMTAQLLMAYPPFERTAVLINLVTEASSPGDPNHSQLLGSISAWRGSLGVIGGVRGLPDNRNRDAFHAFGNLEIRQSFKLAERWFLQFAAFVDGGTYARLDELGKPERLAPALSVGGGIRLVPTFLAWLVPRLDGGSLLLPNRTWFFQFGISQYF